MNFVLIAPRSFTSIRKKTKPTVKERKTNTFHHSLSRRYITRHFDLPPHRTLFTLTDKTRQIHHNEINSHHRFGSSRLFRFQSW